MLQRRAGSFRNKQQANFQHRVEIGLFFTIYMPFLPFRRGDPDRYNQIDQVFFKGFIDEEEIKFKDELDKTLSNIEENSQVFDLDDEDDYDDDDEPKITFELDDDMVA